MSKKCEFEPCEQEEEGRGPSPDRRNEEGFFEISKVVDSPELLKGWIEWFKGLDIPCAVAKVPGGYTLWRKGVEIGRTRARNSVLKQQNIVCSFGI